MQKSVKKIVNCNHKVRKISFTLFYNMKAMLAIIQFVLDKMESDPEIFDHEATRNLKSPFFRKSALVHNRLKTIFIINELLTYPKGQRRANRNSSFIDIFTFK